MSKSLDPVEQWERKLDESALTLNQDVTPDGLAEEFGTDRIDDLCSETLGVAISDGVSTISFDHFETAAERLDGVAEPDSESAPDTDDETAAMLAEARADEASESDETESVDDDTRASEPETDAEPTDSAPSESDERDETVDTASPTTADSEQLQRLQAENQELRDRVNELEHVVNALRRQQKERTKLLTGDETLGTVEPDEIDDVMTRLSSLEDEIATLRKDTQMVRQDGGNGADSPDGRAKILRQTLLKSARTNDGKAKLTRDAAEARLGGGLHRDTVLDAMRRAADGYDADIQGASDLEPVDSITFSVGRGRGSQSQVVMDLSDATGSEIRQNLTTQISQEGGQ